jgi:hypothetical protein
MSPANYTNLSAGGHTFQVRATDPAGNTDPTPASRTWTSSAGTTPQPVGSAETWALAFQDEFQASAVDTLRWNTNEGKRQNGVTNRAANVSVSGGAALLTLSSDSSGAMLSTGPVDGVGSAHYQLPVGGYAEARIYFAGPTDATYYNWPAWWTVGSRDWPKHGENDIAEVAGWASPTRMSCNYHGPGYDAGRTVSGNWANSYHVYGMWRRPGRTDIYYDGNPVCSFSTTDDGAPHSLVLNHGRYSSQSGVHGAASQVKVDYVRAWHPG